MNPLIRPWRQIFNFSGRATRTEYGLFHISFFIVLVGVQVLLFSMVDATSAAPSSNQPTVPLSMPTMIVLALFGILWTIFLLAFLIGHISVCVRRLHDHGDSGLKYLLTFIPLIGLIFWLMMVFTKGDDFENEYGPDPRLGGPATTDELGGVFS